MVKLKISSTDGHANNTRVWVDDIEISSSVASFNYYIEAGNVGSVDISVVPSEVEIAGSFDVDFFPEVEE